MAGSVLHELPAPPSLLGAYLRGLSRRRRRPSFDALPSLPLARARVGAARVEARGLAAFRAVCGFGGDALPVTFPQVITSGLAGWLLAAPDFPLPLLGLVHTRSRMRWRRALGPDEVLSLESALGEARLLDRGLELDLLSRVAVAGEPVWEGTSTVLWRRRVDKQEPRAARPLERVGRFRERWRVAADVGRRYARASGDFNPIHLSTPTARLFGFARPIAHGMWSLSRAIAALADELPPGPAELEVELRRPISLPDAVELYAESTPAALRFAIYDAGGVRLHVQGRVRALSPSP